MGANSLYDNCTLCPRRCGADRNSGKTGYCGMTSVLTVARAAPHMWEEPCISGENGSGTVFFSGCSLRCVYCQNHDIANGKRGKEITAERLAEIFIELQDKKVNNINLVTATHFVPHVTQALDIARQSGLDIPVVYNTSGYETVENIQRLNGYVDVYLPDFKYVEPNAAAKYSNAPDYTRLALDAIAEMLKQTGKPVIDENGIMQRGVIVRHLVLPGNIKNSKAALKLLHDAFGDDIYISVMKQYTPMPFIDGTKYRELKRRLTTGEYNSVVSYAADIGIVNGFIQEGEPAKESFIPEFDNEGV